MVAGFAENTLRDPDPGCPVSQFKPVVWDNGRIQELSTFGDPVGVAAAINDRDQVVGSLARVPRSTRTPDSILWKITPCSGNAAW